MWAMSVALLLVTACSSVTSGQGSAEAPVSEPSADACPDEPVQPDPHRPVIDLRFELDDDASTVTGTEKVVFTPDIATDELVFRLTANQPMSVAAGSGIEVGEVTGDDVQDSDFEPAGADALTQGGLLVVQLDVTLEPGQSTEVGIDFELSLGAGTFDRFGQDRQASWWGSGHPLLAWEPGRGWAREPLVDSLGETATSPAADTTVSVLAPRGQTVLMTGGAEEMEDDGQHTLWRSSSPAARDVSVAVGDFAVAEASVGDSRLIVGAEDPDTAEDLLDEVSVAVDALQQYFGAFPYDPLTVARLDDYGGGIEYPGMILLAGGGETVLVHEVAHMWFYGMVGNDQGSNPWLDESFATYAEGLVTGQQVDPGALQQSLDVGLPIGEFSGAETYIDIVYGKGSAMLDLAREESGADAFDSAIRCYVNANAWQIARPQDVESALRELPAALDVLRGAGAL